MANIPTEKKMQLVHMIREENKSNQLKLRNRENILYGRPFTPALYSVEESEEEATAVSTLKLRFLLAAGLFVAYLVLDMGGGSILGKNAGDLYLMMEEDYQSNVFDFISNITYTLDNKAESN